MSRWREPAPRPAHALRIETLRILVARRAGPAGDDDTAQDQHDKPDSEVVIGLCRFSPFDPRRDGTIERRELVRKGRRSCTGSGWSAEGHPQMS